VESETWRSKNIHLIADLQERCSVLLAELDTFRSHLECKRRETDVEIRSLRNAVQAEAKALTKLAEANPEEDRINHTLRSSNLPFFETVWATAKRSEGVVAFNKRFYWVPTAKVNADAAPKPTTRKSKKYSALVDIVARNGSEWIKVSTITETRLLFELAKQGWERASSSSDDSGDSDSHSDASDDHDEVSILKTAEDLARASHATRIRYKHPLVHFVLPKITPNRVPEIDVLLSSMISTGARLTLAPCPPAPLLSSETLARLTVDETALFTPTLNIDCTILLALTSDLSHAAVTAEPWFHRATRRQIELEASQNLLPEVLYPAMGERRLECTRAAAVRMREIVDTIGTTSERARAKLLLDDGGETGREGILMQMAQLSSYPVPASWKLPIRVVSDDDDYESSNSTDSNTLPAVASDVRALLTPINQSVFLHGWRSGHTTLTSNRTVARQIEAAVEEYLEGRDGEEVEGPKLWLCATSRSLIGKEKGRRP